MIKMKRLHEDAVIPTRGSAEAAGLDLYSLESVEIPAGKRALLRTGIAMAIPKGTVGLIWPRSKLAAKQGIDVLAGVVDSDYRGEIHVSLLNTGEDAVEIRKGDKTAQILIQAISVEQPLEVSELDETERGSAGITSTEMRR